MQNYNLILDTLFLNKTYFLIFFSFLSFLFYFFHGTKSTSEGSNSDQEKQIIVSENYKRWWPWPSNMHNFSDKVAMKDIGVYLLTILHKIFKKNNGYKHIVLISNIAHLLSFFFIYFITEKIFNSQIAFFISVIYYFSIWPYLIILHAGFQILGQLFFLVSVYFLLLVDILSINSLYFSFLSGFFFAISNFASASSRKYIPLYLIFVSYFFFNIDNFTILNNNLFIKIKFAIILFFLFLLITNLIFICFKNFCSEYAVNALYNFKIINYNDIHKKIIYVKKIRTLIIYSAIPLLTFNFFFIFNILFIKNYYSFICFVFLILGIFVLIFLLIYPNFKKSISSFFYYWTIENISGSHFRFYDDYFFKKFKTLYSKNYKRFYLLFVIYFRIMSSYIYIFFGVIILLLLKYQNYEINYSLIFFIALLSLSPLIWSEITGGPKAILPLYNTYIAFFIVLAFLINLFSFTNPDLFEILFYPTLSLYILYNLLIFYLDIYPSRIHIHKIKKYMENHNIKKFYSYDNDYSRDIINLLKRELKNKIEIIFINSIEEINNGIFLQPPINHKSSIYQSSKIGYSTEDFNYDKKLLNLYNHDIESLTIKKFKNRATSRIWQLTGNVSAFRDIILKEIGADEILKSYIRLIKIDKKFLQESKII